MLRKIIFQDISTKNHRSLNMHNVSRLNTSKSQALHFSLSNAVSLNLDSSGHHHYKEKQTSHQLQDQDSSSSQSTSESHLEVPPVEGSNPQVHGCNETCGKRVESPMESVLSLQTPDFVLPDCSQSQSQIQTLACVSYPYPDPYFGRMLAPCGPQTIIHPQIARVPLPLHPAQDEVLYVNPKQYRAILRRRESRAKLEAADKVVKARKPYLHESRHRHACKRVRGAGGRFLNTKKLEQPAEPSPDHNGSGNSQSEMYNSGASTASFSEIPSVSAGYESLDLSDLGFISYPHMDRSLIGERGILFDGSEYCLPVIR